MINQLRDAIEKQKREIIKQLVSGGMLSPADSSAQSLTLSELEWMLAQFKETKTK